MFKEIAKQLRQPTGFLGKVLSKFLKRMNGDIYIQMVKEVDAQDNDEIYEIGYGHGSGVYQLASTANCIVEGIDFSEVMYNDALKLNQKFVTEGRVNLSFGDFLDANIQVESYDKIFCVNVIYFWDDLIQPFGKINKSLKNNGVFLIYMDSLDDIKNSRFTDTDNFNHYDIDFVLSQLNIAGFNATHYNYGRGHIIRALK